MRKLSATSVPADALVFEYRGSWFAFCGYVEMSLGRDERVYGFCIYGSPLDKPITRPDLRALIFNSREVTPLTPAMRVALRMHLSVMPSTEGAAVDDAAGET